MYIPKPLDSDLYVSDNFKGISVLAEDIEDTKSVKIRSGFKTCSRPTLNYKPGRGSVKHDQDKKKNHALIGKLSTELKLEGNEANPVTQTIRM